jgi:tetraacyldisaccharide 4'-kinase
VVDGQTGFGNGRTLPAGPLREPLAQALPRADAFIILNRSPATPKLPTGKPVFFATTQPLAPETLRGQPLIAFCGLGYPQKFFTMLTAHGATLAESAAFPDHHTYTASDLKTLTRLAARHKARLATTAKDAARLPPDALPNLLVVDIQLVFDDQAAFTRLITQTLPHHEEP